MSVSLTHPPRRARLVLAAASGLALVAAPLVAAAAPAYAADGWTYSRQVVSTGVTNGYQMTFDQVNRTAYFTDGHQRTDSRTRVPVYDAAGDEIGFTLTHSATPGTGKVVAIASASREVTQNYDYTGLTRLPTSQEEAASEAPKRENQAHSWTGFALPTAAQPTQSQNSLRTHFSPNGIAVDPLTEYGGVVDPTIITTHVRQRSGGAYGGGVVIYRASQGAPTDADRLWELDNGEAISDGSRRIAVNTKTHKAYIGNFGTARGGDPADRRGYVAVVDLPSKTVEALVEIPAPVDTAGGAIQDGGPIDVAVDEANNLVYVGMLGPDNDKLTKLFRIDASNLDTSAPQNRTLNASKVTELPAAVPSNARPTYSAELKKLYIASYDPQTITVVDADLASAGYGQVLHTIETGRTNAVEVDAERGLLYSANLQDREIVVYDVNTYAELLRLPTSGNVAHLGIDPVTHDVWASNFGTSTGGKADVFTVKAPTKAPVVTLGKAVVETTATKAVLGRSATTTVVVTDEEGRAATGSVTLTGAGKSVTQRLSRGAATFALPTNLARKAHTLTFSYSGNDTLAAATTTARHTVTKAGTKVTRKVTKKPTSKKTGTLRATVRQASGSAKVTGKVTVTLKKGKVTKKVTKTVKAGAATVKLPKLAKGTWKVTVRYAGSTSYKAATLRTTLKVTR